MPNAAGSLPMWALVLVVAAMAPFAARWLTAFLDVRARQMTKRALTVQALAEETRRPHL